MSTRAARRALPIVIAVVGCVSPSTARAQQYAIVVNPANGTDELTLDQVKRVFLGHSAALPNGRPAEVAFLAPERAAFARQVLCLHDASVRRRWIGLELNGETTAKPRDLAGVALVKRFVTEHPNAVAFLRAEDADDAVKVLRVDGKVPSDSGYVIR
jgi:hypothetical protein